MSALDLYGQPPRARGDGARHPIGTLWSDVMTCASLALVIAVPTMVVEEDWHGHPMIDQSTHLWIVAVVLVAGAFLVAGLVTGRHRPAAALRRASAGATLALGVLVGAALGRRLLIVHETVPKAVIELWCAGVVGCLVLSATGAWLGRWLAGHS
jgi:hypothetical protein